MNEKQKKECIDVLFELYPRFRKLMYEAFDKLEDDLTRTQQIILLVLDIEDNLSMSNLAYRICTSNEQATRAVTQLVDKGLVNRAQNKTNRRVVNISLTQKAKDHVAAAKKAVMLDTSSRFGTSRLSDEEYQQFYDAIRTAVRFVYKVEEKKYNF
ncbi:MAG: MarR family transcriptional regulator [Ruminococcus sp.]|nr:MarR family transcriptional regulator [Ruminococcus sp.]